MMSLHRIIGANGVFKVSIFPSEEECKPELIAEISPGSVGYTRHTITHSHSPLSLQNSTCYMKEEEESLYSLVSASRTQLILA